jgi:uncharacterized protein YqgV (UPF0045/DUF77 family)
MTLDLTTTNVLLGIMAAVSLLEGLAVAGALLGGFLIYRRVMQVVTSIEERQVAPAVARVNAILDDVKEVTSTVRQETGRIERLMDWILEAIGRTRSRAHEESSNRVM